MLQELSDSAFSKWVASARFVYPTLLTAHGLGVAIVVGITVMIALRVLGFPGRSRFMPMLIR
jgi:predicted alpha/beta hydrolase family esterase